MFAKLCKADSALLWVVVVVVCLVVLVGGSSAQAVGPDIWATDVQFDTGGAGTNVSVDNGGANTVLGPGLVCRAEDFQVRGAYANPNGDLVDIRVKARRWKQVNGVWIEYVANGTVAHNPNASTWTADFLGEHADGTDTLNENLTGDQWSVIEIRWVKTVITAYTEEGPILGTEILASEDVFVFIAG